MGGEKLKTFRYAVFIIASICLLFFFSGAAGLSAQAQPGTAVLDAGPPDESQLLLEDAPPAGPGQGGTSIWLVLRMVLVLALVAAAVYGIVFILKRVARPREGTDPNLKVLSSAYLGSGRYVHAISVGSKAWLVGSSDGGVTLIAPLEEKEAVDAMIFENARRAAEGGRGKMPDFRSLLRRLGAGAVPEGRPTPENLRKQRDRLKGL